MSRLRRLNNLKLAGLLAIVAVGFVRILPNPIWMNEVVKHLR
jgi:hypothetical protein